MTPPFMAQGMAQGMRDAQNLAWKLQRVVSDGVSDTLLDTYEQERKPHATATTRTAMALGRVICESDPQRAARRDADLLAEQGGTVRTVICQDLIPGLHDGLVRAGPLAGAVLPQPAVRCGGFTGRLDDLTGATLRVVTTRTLDPGERLALLDGLRPLGGVLISLDDDVHEVDTERVLSTWLLAAGADFAVVRPDHYLYATAATVIDTLTHLEELCRHLVPQVDQSLAHRSPAN